MSQIISIHIGGSGAKVGVQFWKQLNQKNKLTQQNKAQNLHFFSRFYSCSLKNVQKPRAIFLDTDIRTKNLVQAINLGDEMVVANGSSCQNLFSEGFYGQGAQLIQPFMQKIRNQAEKCDKLTGFLVTNSIAGGAGSGLKSNAISKVYQRYPDPIIQNFQILDGTNSTIGFKNLDPIQIYNAFLGTHYSIQLEANPIYCLENLTAESKLFRKHNKHVDLNQINSYYAKCICQHISSYIFPGTLNTNQRKRAVNLIPYPRLKYICGISSDDEKRFIESSLHNKNKLMYHSAPSRIFSINLNVNDELTSQNQVMRIVNEWKATSEDNFTKCMPNSIHMSIGSCKSSLQQKSSSWSLINGSSNIEWLKQISLLYTKQFRRKAFMHYYLDRMEEIQFLQAETNCNDLVLQYFQDSFDLVDQYEQI